MTKEICNAQEHETRQAVVVLFVASVHCIFLRTDWDELGTGKWLEPGVQVGAACARAWGHASPDL